MHLIWANHARVCLVLVAHGIANHIIAKKLTFHTKIFIHAYSSNLKLSAKSFRPHKRNACCSSCTYLIVK